MRLFLTALTIQCTFFAQAVSLFAQAHDNVTVKLSRSYREGEAVAYKMQGINQGPYKHRPL